MQMIAALISILRKVFFFLVNVMLSTWLALYAYNKMLSDATAVYPTFFKIIIFSKIYKLNLFW